MGVVFKTLVVARERLTAEQRTLYKWEKVWEFMLDWEGVSFFTGSYCYLWERLHNPFKD